MARDRRNSQYTHTRPRPFVRALGVGHVERKGLILRASCVIPLRNIPLALSWSALDFGNLAAYCSRLDCSAIKDHFLKGHQAEDSSLSFHLPVVYPSDRVFIKATIAFSSSSVRPKFPSSSLLRFDETSGSGQQFTPGLGSLIFSHRGSTSLVL